jgi:hypothetical protein
MKTIIKLLAISVLPLAFSACSKKMTAFQFGTLSHQETVTASANVNTENSSITTSSDETEGVVVIENPTTFTAKQLNEPTKLESIEKFEKPTLKQRLIQKAVAKKIKKTEKLQMSSNMKLGIIIAAVSLLVLIIVAAGLLGGLSGLFWLLGGLGLLTGFLIILLVALDVI